MYTRVCLNKLLVGLLGCFTLLSCSKKDYLPLKRENLGSDATFNQQVFQPVLGRTTQYSGIFQPGTTTYPVEFRLINVRSMTTGIPATEVTNLYPVKVWTQAYTGKETSIEEIEAKRTVQYRSILEVGAGSGDLTMWYIGSSSFMKALPDSGYIFDIEASNSGGRKYFTDFKLQPQRERPFEPSNINTTTGQPTSNGIYPTLVNNITGDSTNLFLSPADVSVFIRKVNGGLDSNKLTFRFFDKNYNVIDPNKFGTTNWSSLVHGFNMNKTTSSVTYDVSYPLPSTSLQTQYTNSTGDRAHIVFSYNRLNAFGVLSEADLGLDFAIYESGNWEVVFVFLKDNPRFRNE